jgi:hypothetical protein
VRHKHHHEFSACNSATAPVTFTALPKPPGRATTMTGPARFAQNTRGLASQRERSARQNARENTAPDWSITACAPYQHEQQLAQRGGPRISAWRQERQQLHQSQCWRAWRTLLTTWPTGSHNHLTRGFVAGVSQKVLADWRLTSVSIDWLINVTASRSGQRVQALQRRPETQDDTRAGAIDR